MTNNQPIVLNPNMNLSIKKNKITWRKNITFGKNCRNVSIGYGCFFGNDIYIDVEDLVIGDYVTIHHGSIIHGKQCKIGHNSWIGHYTILDSLGGSLIVGNNVGIGAHSQIWTHMKFGDRLAGYRWYRTGNLEVGDDAWFVGHCIVASKKVEPRSMLLVGSVAIKDMKENHIYSGSPAVDITEKMGYQFNPTGIEDRVTIFNRYIDKYKQNGFNTDFIKIIDSPSDAKDSKYTYFNLRKREYQPQYSEEENRFIRYLLYDKAKFIPTSFSS